MLPRLCLGLLLAALFLSFPLVAAAQATSGCNAYIPATVQIEPVYDETVYEAVPMIKIRELAGAEKSGVAEQWPVGLATARAILKVQTDIYKIRSGYNQFSCGQIKNLIVKLGFEENRIYIAKEFPKRSCPYKTVLAHEEMHKQVDQQILEEYSEKIRLAFGEAARKIGVVKNVAANMIDEQINEQMALEIDRLAKDMEDERHARQHAVDSPEEYKRVTESCEGRTMETVQQRLELLEATHPGITKSVFHPGEKVRN